MRLLLHALSSSFVALSAFGTVSSHLRGGVTDKSPDNASPASASASASLEEASKSLGLDEQKTAGRISKHVSTAGATIVRASRDLSSPLSFVGSMEPDNDFDASAAKSIVVSSGDDEGFSSWGLDSNPATQELWWEGPDQELIRDDEMWEWEDDGIPTMDGRGGGTTTVIYDPIEEAEGINLQAPLFKHQSNYAVIPMYELKGAGERTSRKEKEEDGPVKDRTTLMIVRVGFSSNAASEEDEAAVVAKDEGIEENRNREDSENNVDDDDTAAVPLSKTAEQDNKGAKTNSSPAAMNDGDDIYTFGPLKKKHSSNKVIIIADAGVGPEVTQEQGNAAVPQKLEIEPEDRSNQSNQDSRSLLAPWCPPATPVMWHPDYKTAWNVAGCDYKADCDSPGYETELQCCNEAFRGQVSGVCTGQLDNPNAGKWYADYASAWSSGGCKNTAPYPIYAATFFSTQLECCKTAYAGQVSGACVDGLPNRPTMAPITAGGVGGKWYADYSTAWVIAGCKNAVPYPSHATVFYDSQLACCKSAYSNQMSGACIKGLLRTPTMSPTKPPTKKPTASPTNKPTSRPTSTPTITPTITVALTGTASIPVLPTGRRLMRQLTSESISSVSEEVFKEAFKEILRTALDSRQTLVDVNILSASIVSGVILVTFEVILKEICSASCTIQQASTQLDDVVNNKLASSIVDGSFALALKNEANSATVDSSDTLLSSFSRLDTTAGAATLNVTISVTVTTNSPTITPTNTPTTNVPTESPSGLPSLSSSPSVEPSEDPSSKPSETPSLKPSSSPSMGPSEVASSKPSERPSLKPSSHPSGGPSLTPSRLPSLSSSPSMGPSEDPSSKPSETPSLKPSPYPSGGPSLTPSRLPSLSSSPSMGPSEDPSSKPSETSSLKPSSYPSNGPSENPTSIPSETSYYSYVQRGIDLDGEADNDYSGYVISLSDDGDTLAVGAPANDGNGGCSGHARVYSWNANENKYIQRGSDIDGENAGDLSGFSVSLSEDGDVLAIGAPRNDGNGDDSGHVRVYSWNLINNQYIQRGPDIDGEAAGDYFGEMVSLSGDGNTLVVGAPRNDANGDHSGHVRVYSWNVSQIKYIQRGFNINGEDAGDASGRTVSSSYDGDTLAIGAFANDGNGDNSGHVRVYSWNAIESKYIQRGSDIDGENAGDLSGLSVSLSEDGDILAIGAPFNDGNPSDDGAGHVRVYSWKENESKYIQRGSDINGENFVDFSGSSVSLSDDGDVLAIGAPFNDGNGDESGHVRVYSWNVNYNEYIQRGSDINGEGVNDFSGTSVSISGDGNVLAIGATGFGNNRGPGCVRVYNWELSERPSSHPSGRPSLTSSRLPSLSSSPSMGPSEEPSSFPSGGPSENPSTSLNPSESPSRTLIPSRSLNPSWIPSNSQSPSQSPSVYCFKTNELPSAVDDYINENCSANSTCRTRLKYGEIGTWCTAEVTDMSYLFAGYQHSGTTTTTATMGKQTFNVDISRWNVSSVTNMKYMFSHAYRFNQNLNSWDVHSVTNIEGIFLFASDFNQPLNGWDTSSVTMMDSVFYYATSFNQPLDGWDTHSVTRMGTTFRSASSFNQNLSSWKVGLVTSMGYMFESATSFNQNISNWDVKSVQDMAFMFNSATSFNQNLASWDISSVKSTWSMFNMATSFNQDLCQWGLFQSFPWLSSMDMFLDSGCSVKTSPVLNFENSNVAGPFCASTCSD